MNTEIIIVSKRVDAEAASFAVVVSGQSSGVPSKPSRKRKPSVSSDGSDALPPAKIVVTDSSGDSVPPVINMVDPFSEGLQLPSLMDVSTSPMVEVFPLDEVSLITPPSIQRCLDDFCTPLVQSDDLIKSSPTAPGSLSLDPDTVSFPHDLDPGSSLDPVPPVNIPAVDHVSQFDRSSSSLTRTSSCLAIGSRKQCRRLNWVYEAQTRFKLPTKAAPRRKKHKVPSSVEPPSRRRSSPTLVTGRSRSRSPVPVAPVTPPPSFRMPDSDCESGYRMVGADEYDKYLVDTMYQSSFVPFPKSTSFHSLRDVK